jgi:hypothetical protein
MTNRITEMIAKKQARIYSGMATPEQLRKLETSMRTPTKDLIEYQSLQAQAHAMNKITSEEAQTVYKLLGGENPTEEKWNKLSLPEKVAITQLMSEILDWKVKLIEGAKMINAGKHYSVQSTSEPTRRRKTKPEIGGTR